MEEGRTAVLPSSRVRPRTGSSTTLPIVIGPLLLLAALTVAGALSGGWAGAVVGAGVAVLVTLAVAAMAATWADRIGRLLDPDEARRLAPRPPGFGPLCDAVVARVLGRSRNG